jgi:hypothetical protein
VAKGEKDIDFDRSTVHVCQSAWRGKIQSPKGERAISLSLRILARLAEYCGPEWQTKRACSLPRETAHPGMQIC